MTTTTLDLVREASPKIAAIGPAFYFTPETAAVAKEHGLDLFQLYFLGRGGVLGDVAPDVVTSAFGYFNPPVVAHMWTTAQQLSSLTPRDAGRLYMQCTHDFGRQHLSDVPELAEFCAAAEKVNDNADRAGLPLYAGIAAEPLAEDLPARAMQLNTVLREHRGSAHLVAVLATPGLTPKVAHAIRRPDFWALFGYDEADRPSFTDAERAALEQSDELTDQIVADAFEVLDDNERAALRSGLEAIERAIPPMAVPGQ
jgi:hypothetical protein